jgi:acetyl esterase/lipase
VAQGYAVACVNYRLSSEAQFSAQISDCRAAIRWLRDHAQRYRLDPPHFGVVGVSAGGYLAALVGTAHQNHLLDAPGDLGQSVRVQAVCIFFGPIDLLRLYDYSEKLQTPQADEVVKLLGSNPRLNPEPARLANPLTYLEADAPPFLLVHGLNDTVVPPEQSRLLYDALASRKIPVHLHLIRDAGHTGPAFVALEINAMMDDFFARALKLPPGPPDTNSAVLTESTARND